MENFLAELLKISKGLLNNLRVAIICSIGVFWQSEGLGHFIRAISGLDTPEMARFRIAGLL
jgi:hypothetical protein